MYGDYTKPKQQTNKPTGGADGLEQDRDILPAHMAKQFEKQAPKERERETFEIYSENWLAWTIFWECRTQWRTSMSGPTGLDYNVLLQVMDLYQVRHKLPTLQKIKCIESGVLAGINGVPRSEVIGL